jgi:hypothetical protein
MAGSGIATSSPTIPHPPAPPRPPTIKSDRDWAHLKEYNKKYLGMADFDATAATLGECFYSSLTNSNVNLVRGDTWKVSVPSSVSLRTTGFGKPDLAHSFLQEASFETTMVHVLKSGYLDVTSTLALCDSHRLTMHLASASVAYADYNFNWLRNYDHNWEDQREISKDKMAAMTAALLHFNLDTSLLMRYLGNNYTGAYREVDLIVKRLRELRTDEELIDKYIRVMLTGCPNHFVAETTRANALLHWRMRNGPTIDKKLPQAMKSMNKEDKNNFVIPLPHWLARYIPNLFFTPQHILEKPGKKDRQISDGSKRYTPFSTPINMMTSTPRGTEETCDFGDVREQILQRLYNCRISFPHEDIVIHANDVKSAFRQIKLHPDIMGAFSFIIADHLFLSCGLPFGTDFSPANWEVVRKLLEAVAKALFNDDSLVDKHRKYLDRLKYDRSLGRRVKMPFTRAQADEFNQGIRDVFGDQVPTPHFYYVDDGVYVDLYDIMRIEKAVAASIEAVFLLLGYSDLDKRQDPISFDKLMDMIISYTNKILGHIIDTRRLTIETPPEFVAEVLTSLETTWGPHRKQFHVHEAAELAGKLGHMSIAAPWLKFLMTHLYSSLAHALRLNRWDLIQSSRSFREAIKKIRHADLEMDPDHASRVRSFYQAETARGVHANKKRHLINKTMRKELKFIRTVLKSRSIPLDSPIAHLIKKAHAAEAFGDSSLHAAGGYCPELKFWWYFEWPEEIRLRTLKYVRNNEKGILIDINVLEYAAILINFIIATYFFRHTKYLDIDPHPIVLLRGDNTASEAWTRKGSKHSPSGRALGKLQCATMINNPVGLRFSHITSGENDVADKISRVLKETHFPGAFLHLCQEFPDLIGCRRFQPSSELISCITGAILSAECINPLELNRLLLNVPGRIIT